MYRHYPLKAGSSGLSVYGEQLPTSLLTSLSLSIPLSANIDTLYISKIVTKNNFISVVINSYTSDLAVGSFSKAIVEDYQTINLTSYISGVSGQLTVGKLNALVDFQGAFHFQKENAEIEESTIFVYPTPAVTAVVNNSTKSTGKISLLGKNVSIAVEGNDITLDVIEYTKVLAHNALAGQYDNCTNPIIEKINTVTPDEDGNIDIYTILPMTIDVSGENLELTPNLTIEQVCPELNKIYPPLNISDTYYSDILTEKTPEWKTWPYFS